VGESSEERESSDDVEYCQLLKDYHEVQANLSSTRLNAETLRDELDATHDVLQASKNLVSQVQGDVAITQGQVQHMTNLIVVLTMRVETLQLSMLAAYNTAFPVRTMDNLFTAEEHLRALPARLRAVVTEAIRHGAATALAAA
jgi:hypothetical protein